MRSVRQVAVLANVARRYDRRVIQGIASYLREAGGWSLYVEDNPLQKLPKLRQWRGHGIIADFDDRKIALAVAGLTIPVVGFGGGRGWYTAESRIPYFTTDNPAIGRLGAEHLVSCGLVRLAFYSNPRTRLHRWAEERTQAFAAVARAARLPCTIYRGQLASADRWLAELEELAGWLASLDKPVGLMACTDIRARQVLEACRMLGLRVPDDVAVLGVDNDEMMCELTNPPLSSIEQGSRRIGYEAAALLDRLMSGRAARQLQHIIPPEGLVARQSTDVLACDDPDLSMAVRFVRDHACDPIRVADVLAAVPLSRSTLEKRFLATLGRTIHAEIQRVQVERAKQLLVRTNLLVKQIAQRAGFKWVPYLTRVFRQHTGLSPVEYRRRFFPGAG